MRATTVWAKWATCALAISVAMPALSPALAEKARARKSLADCTAFDQADKGDDGVEFTIRNSCSIPVDCAISWQVVCAPDSRKRKSLHPGSSKLSLTDGGSQSAAASAAVCGDDGWSLQSIQWSCTPNKE